MTAPHRTFFPVGGFILEPCDILLVSKASS
jgi:hypothetical protein